MTTIIVTGGSGLVGQAVQKIKDSYPSYTFHFLSTKDADLSNYNQTKELFKKLKPHSVIHLAAFVGGLFKNMNHKVDMFEKKYTYQHERFKSVSRTQSLQTCKLFIYVYIS